MKSVNNKQKTTRKSGTRNPNRTITERTPIFKNIVSPRVVTFLTYRMDPASINNTGFRSASRSFRANSANDVDMALGSTALIGHYEWSQFFETYRVLSVRMHAEGYNMDTNPVLIALGFNVDAFGLNGVTRSHFPNPLWKHKSVGGSSGNNKVILDSYATNETIVGDRLAINSSAFVAAVATNPAYQTYCFLAIDTGTTGVLVNGMIVELSITLEVEYFGRKAMVGL